MLDSVRTFAFWITSECPEKNFFGDTLCLNLSVHDIIEYLKSYVYTKPVFDSVKTFTFWNKLRLSCQLCKDNLKWFFPRGLTRPQQSRWPWRKIYCTGRLFLSFWGYFSTRTSPKNQRIEIHLGHGHKRGPKCFLYLWSSSGNLLYIFAFTATIQRIWKKMFREKTFFS